MRYDMTRHGELRLLTGMLTIDMWNYLTIPERLKGNCYFAWVDSEAACCAVVLLAPPLRIAVLGSQALNASSQTPKGFVGCQIEGLVCPAVVPRALSRHKAEFL